MPGREVDHMLFMCICFMQLCQSARLFKGSAIREIRRSMSELRFDLAGQYGEAGKSTLMKGRGTKPRRDYKSQ